MWEQIVTFIKDNLMWVCIGAGVVVLLLIVLIVALAKRSKKKKLKQQQELLAANEVVAPEEAPAPKDEIKRNAEVLWQEERPVSPTVLTDPVPEHRDEREIVAERAAAAAAAQPVQQKQAAKPTAVQHVDGTRILVDSEGSEFENVVVLNRVEPKQKPAPKQKPEETISNEVPETEESVRLPGTIMIYLDAGGKFRFRYIASNGNIVGHSQGYASKSGCKNGIAAVERICENAIVVDLTKTDVRAPMGKASYEIYRDKEDKFRFRLRSSNMSTVLASQGYVSKDSCFRGIQSIKNIVNNHVVKDKTLAK